MRKTSYFVTFCLVAGIFLINFVSSRRPDWLIVQYEEILYTKLTVYYGLNERCELTVSEVPGPSKNGKISYRNYECRSFPNSTTDLCDKENKAFCAVWTSAGYLDQIAMGFAAVSLVAILFGVSTHSRRRRIWRAVAGLVMLQAACQIATFAVVTEMYRSASYPTFERARPGPSYILHTFSWISSIIVAVSVIMTGISAGVGQTWAAGNHAYQPINP